MDPKARRARDAVLFLDEAGGPLTSLAQALQSQGLDVRVANDPMVATVELLAVPTPAVIVRGAALAATGYRFLHTLRQHPQTRDPSVLVLVEPNDRMGAMAALEAGADTTLPDDVTAAEVGLWVRAQLLRRTARDRHLTRQQQVQELLDCLAEPLLLAGRGGRVHFANRAARRLLELNPDVLRLLSLEDLLERLGVSPAVTRNLLASSEQRRDVNVALGPRELHLRFRAHALGSDDEDDALRIVAIEDLGQGEALDRARAELHSMVAHDLRNPIHVIQRYLELLRDPSGPPLDERRQEFVAAIDEKVADAAALLEEFLDFSRLDAGFLTVRREAVPLGSLVAGVIRDMHAMAEPRGVRVVSCVGDDVDDVTLQTDAQRLRQVLQNLVLNAIKFTPAGGAVRVGVDRELDAVRVWVVDEGVGIAPQDVPVVFERYVRSHARTEGVGLGLAIVRRVVEGMGGTVGVRSELGRGSLFWFRLPAPVPGAVAQPEPRTPVAV